MREAPSPASAATRLVMRVMSVMIALVELAASADCSASLRTSSATTAKPLPLSPARAASMAAFSASRFVCSAIVVIVTTKPVISAERRTSASEASVMAAADSSTAVMAVRASSAVSMPRSASASAASAASAAASAACSARSTAAATSPAASPASITSRDCCSVTDATLPTASAISLAERSESAEAAVTSLRGLRDVDGGGLDRLDERGDVPDAAAQDGRGAVAGLAGDAQVAALERLGQPRQLSALGGVLDAQRGGRQRLGLQRAREDDQHDRLEDHEDGVQQHHAETRGARGHHPDGRARVLEHHEPEVVQRDEARGEHDHAPVAVDQQERQHAEDVEVHLDQPVRLADEQRGVRHQAAGR